MSDDDEMFMTQVVRVLIENTVITFGGAAMGGIGLGPTGIALGGSAASFLHLILSGGISTWNEMRSVHGWKDMVMLTLKVAAELAIKNAVLLYKLAVSIARLLERIYNSNQYAMPISR